MPQVCTICSHESRHEIEDAVIVHSQAKRRVAAQHGVTEQSLRRHLREHLPALLALARDAEQAARADSLLDRIEALHARTLAILKAAEKTHQYRTALAAIREARGNLELIGEVTKELNRTPTLNLSLHPEYIEVRTLIVEALASYPEAKDAVARALENGTGGAD